MAEAVGTIRVDLFANVAEFGEGLGKASGQLKRFARDAEKTAKQFDKVGKDLTRNLTLPLAVFGGLALKASADAQDLQGAFNVSFASMSTSANAWAVATGDALGRSTQTVQTTAIAFNEFFEDFAPNSAAALDLSKSFTVLTEDFAAFHNVSREQSQQVLLSGLAGSAKALKKFGIDISDTAVKQRAYSLGIAKVNSDLTEQQAVLARASIIISGTAKETGEVTRSQGEAAEETERAKEAFKELLVTVGNDLLPIFTEFLQGVHGIIDGFNGLDKGTRQVILTVAGVAAVAGPAALAIGAMTRAAGVAATALRAMTAASVSSAGGIKQVGISAGSAAVSFLVLAPAAFEAGKAIGSVVDAAFAPKFEDVKQRAEALRDALISSGVGADQARDAVVQLLNTSGGNLSKLTIENARALLGQAAATTEVADAAAAAAPDVDALLRSFGQLAPSATDTAEAFKRVRDAVNPTAAAVRTYTENLATAKAAGVNAADAQRVFGAQLIEAVGGIDGARAKLEELPPAVQAVVQSMTEADAFATALENLAARDEAAADKLKKIQEDAAEFAQQAEEDRQAFADSLVLANDPAAAFADQMAKIDEVWAEGKISADVYRAARDAAFAETPEGKAQEAALKDRAMLVHDLAGGLTEVALAGDDAAEVARNLILELLKAQFIKPFFEGLVGGIVPQPGGGGGGSFGFGDIARAAGSFFGFGGSKDTGGPVFPGMSYRIGSGVQEDFTPAVPGHISRGPGNASSGSGGNTFIFNTPDANSFRASRRQVSRDMRRSLDPTG